MARKTPPPPNPGWTLLGWLNLAIVLLVVLLFTGTRPTLGQIVGGTIVFVVVGILFVWKALQTR
jgi:hypothetical protein